MKTHLIDKLLAPILVVELPEDKENINLKDWYIDDTGNFRQSVIGFDNDYWNRREDYIRVPDELVIMIPKLKFLDKPDEIKEEDVKDLVSAGNLVSGKKVYHDYRDDTNCFPTALESFNSALESEIYWENPYPIPSLYDPRSKTGRYELHELEEKEKQFNKAEAKTFDKSRTIILKKV